MIKSKHMDFAYMDVLMSNLQCFFCFFNLCLESPDVIEYLATLFIAQFVDLSVKN